MAGGAEIMIYGVKLIPTPSDNLVNFHSYSTNEDLQCPALSGNNEFRSMPSDGKLQYSTPSLSTVLQQSPDEFSTTEWITLEVRTQATEAQGGSVYQCDSGSKCQVSYSRAYTPILYEVNPPVAYHGSLISYMVDPKSAQNIKGADETPILEAKIGTQLINFEDYMDETTVLSGYNKNQVMGEVGDVEPSLSVKPSMRFKSGFAQTQDYLLTTCSYDNTDCYQVRTVASIDVVSASTGYTAGGQLLTISGHGFTQDVSVQVDGVTCVVQTFTDKEVICQTGSKVSPSTSAPQAGAHGLRAKTYNFTSGQSINSFSSLDYYEDLALRLESFQNQGTYFGRVLSGYFKAPASTNYKFYLSCDDTCELWLSSSSDPADKTRILYNSKVSKFRDFYANPDQISSDISLIEGNFYYIEARHLQQSGGEHISIGVEIQQSSIPNHHNAVKEVQRLQINPTNDREKTVLTVLNPDLDTGSFNVYIYDLQNVKNGPYSIPVRAAAWQVRDALYAYYITLGASISVSVVMTNAAGDIVTNVALSTQSVYTISFLRQRSTLTSSRILIVPVGTITATATVVLPQFSPSSAPLSGAFTITCANYDGTTNTTAEIPVSAYPNTISQNIIVACPSLRDKFDLWDGTTTYNYYEDGRDLLIKFHSLNYDVDQFTIQSGTNNVIAGNLVVFNQITQVAKSSNVFYAPIPYDLLFTNEVAPQVQVSVKGIPAVCSGLACSYSYVAAPSQIAYFTYSGSTLTITGTSLPTSILDIYFGLQLCTVSTSSTTQIVCTISGQIVSGSWLPKVRDENGFVPVSVSNNVTPISAISITPNSNLNPNGGTILTISGSNFPNSLTDGSSTSFVFADSTVCKILTTQSNQITCQTGKFATASLGNSKTLTITINGQTSSSLSVAIASSSVAVSSISPNTHSPVLKSLLTLTFSSAYTGAYSLTEFKVTLVSTTDSTNTKSLNVVSFDSSARQIVVKYGGAISGIYKVKVYSTSYGDFDTSSLTFQAKGVITSFSPNSGSLYGGTLVTINGLTFSTDATENPVLIGTTPCDIITSTATQITCRTQPRLSATEGTDRVLVFLKTSEEAVCQAGSCSFQWTSTSIPELTSYAATFNTVSNKYQVTFTGTGFDGSSSNTALFVDGNQQQIDSVSSTELVATITNITDHISTNIQFHLLTGTPSSADSLTSTGLSLDPKLVSITPNTGSPAGSIILANVQGVGINTKLVNLYSGSAQLCSKVVILSYGLVQCTTNAITFASASQITVKIGSSIAYPCANTDTTQCLYSTSSTSPAITGVSISSDNTKIVFTGINFPTTSAYTAIATFSGISSSSSTVDSSTQVTATFANGVPISALALIPTLFFNKTADGTGNFASNTQTLTNAFSLTSSSSSVACSFAGGCLLQVVSNGGLTTSVKAQQAKITVCGRECVLDEATSISTTTQCKVPALPTIYSNNNFQISTTSFLKGETQFSTNSAKTDRLFDMDNVNGYIDTAATCNFGVSFKVGHVGIINQVKFFLNVFTKDTYVDNLTFQGSQDGVSYTNLFTVADEIHEGWNYYDQAAGKEFLYRYYRFQGKGVGSCNVGEFGLRGVEAINNTDSSYPCTSQVEFGTQTFALSSTTVTYSAAKTPSLTAISPRFGTVTGGTQITFTGTNFPTDSSLVSVIIDNQACNNITSTSTTVKCITSKRPGLFPTPTLQFTISGQGNVATHGLIFRYVSLWSDTITWGGEFAPVDGETVYIPPGLNLLVDVDSTPKLNLVLVEGALLFPPHETNNQHLRTFDATYVLVKGGYLEIGTEQFPYTSKLIITMHGEKATAEMPIYGNKVIGVRNGILEMHGVPRNPTWTELQSTVNPGDQTITLNTAVDWQVGETIVIASTSYDCFDAEKVDITSIDRTIPNRPVIGISKKLSHKHYAGIENYGTETLEMRAEVGLLTRNIVYRGDPETSSRNQFGAHIMLHSHGDESLTGRIEYIELRDVGQAFQLGRYPIHFHQIGTVSNSYIRGNAIYNTYNRAVTIHAVQYLRVIRNVAYNTMGHTFFIEDAIETKNFLDGNLAIQTKRSWSLLNTDQTPASFWITNPDNIFRNNRAAGSERYGFWFDLQPNPTGPSFDPNICPINAQLGEFTNNTAHSNGRYGLRIFHGLVPRAFPCQPVVYDPSKPLDPFWKNPLITANFVNFLGYKNQVNGAIVEKVGDVRFTNFKVADNLVAGIEFSLTDQTADNRAQINGALVVGHSANSEQETLDSPLYGIITARTENFTVSNVKFYNFDLDGHAAIGTCSHCFHPASTDSGARTITFSKLFFDTSVKKRIRYQFPYRDIMRDTDGTLTGEGPNAWATPYWKHNDKPECKVDMDIFDGIICDNTVQIRRIAFDGYAPTIFVGMEIKVIAYDDDIINAMDATQLEDYLLDHDNYAVLPYKKSQGTPEIGWALPFITDHKYKVHWRAGLDFMNMRMTLSERWKKGDKGIELLFNYTDVRAAIDVVTPDGNITNGTFLTTPKASIATGDNLFQNETNRTFQIAVNGFNWKRNPVNFVAYRCIGPCMDAINETVIENTTRLWSDIASWGTLGRLPIAGEDVEIKSGWNMVLDLEETPILRVLQINGRLSFLDDGVTPITLKAKHVFVRAGQLFIGNETSPYTSNAQIILYGKKNESSIVYTNAIEAGNKLIANTGTMKLFGQKRSNQVVRLTKTTVVNDTSIYVDTGLDWKAGDKIGLAPTSVVFNDSDYAVIVSYDSSTGKASLDRKLTGQHFGAAQSTALLYNGVDIRGEVFLLSRNIRILGEDVESWGCQIVTSDFIEADETERNGHTILDNVEIYNCSQYDTYKAALRFEGAAQKWSSVTNSAIYHGNGWGVHMLSSANIFFQNNVVFGFIVMNTVLDMVSNVTLDGNMFVSVKIRDLLAVDHLVDPVCGLAVCSFILGDSCTGLKVTNNVVAGSTMFGITAPGHNCNDKNDQSFKNNIVHSVDGIGAAIFPVPGNAEHEICFEGSNIVAYKVKGAGVFTFYKSQKVQFSNLTLIDNRWGVSQNLGQEGDKLEVVLKDSFIYGETESRDCFEQNQCIRDPGNAGCTEKHGVMVPEYDVAGKAIFPRSSSAFPLWKIKAAASWGGVGLHQNVIYSGFTSNKTWCGTRQTIFDTNPTGADYHPRLSVKNSKFTNVHQDAVSFMFSPPVSWAVIDDCGLFPCTGPKNSIIDFQGITYVGTTTPFNTKSNFQVIANNNGVGNAITSGCKFYPSWNSYYCESSNLGVLLFESIDGDKTKRTFSPMIISNAQTGFSNTLNTFEDHTWDGFYTGQIRLSRFPSLIETGMMYNVSYAGTPPSNQRYKLIADNSGVTVHIKYTKPGAYSINDQNGNTIQGNSWDDTVKNVGTIKGSKCGENRYLGVDNILEFYLTPNCMVNIAPIDQILTRVRLNWTLDAFYADGGATKFVDRLSASLGIAASTIKVVSVYQGSVQIVFQVIDLHNDTTFITSVKNKLNTGLKSGSIYLGAQVLEYQQNLGSIVTLANVTVTAPTTSSSVQQTTATSSSTGGSTIILDKDGKPIVQVQNSNSTSSNSTKTDTSLDSSKTSSSNLVKILLITIIIFAAFVLSIVIGFCVYRKYYSKTMIQQLQQVNSNSDSPDDKKKQKGFDDIEVYSEKAKSQVSGGVFSNMFKRRPSTKPNVTDGHQIVIQNVESQAAENQQEHPNENNQWNTYSSINKHYDTSSNNLVGSQSVLQNSEGEIRSGTQRITLFKGKNMQVHSELSINEMGQSLGNVHAVPYMVSPSKSSFIVHEDLENTEVKIKTPSPKKTDSRNKGNNFGTFQTK